MRKKIELSDKTQSTLQQPIRWVKRSSQHTGTFVTQEMTQTKMSRKELAKESETDVPVPSVPASA